MERKPLKPVMQSNIKDKEEENDISRLGKRAFLNEDYFRAERNVTF